MDLHDTKATAISQPPQTRGLGWKMKTTLMMAGLTLLQSLNISGALAAEGDGTPSTGSNARRKVKTEQVRQMGYRLADKISMTLYGEQLDSVLVHHPEIQQSIFSANTYEQMSGVFKAAHQGQDSLTTEQQYSNTVNDIVLNNDLANEALAELKDSIKTGVVSELEIGSVVQGKKLEDLKFNREFGTQKKKLFGRIFHGGTDIKAEAGTIIVNPVIGGATVVRSYKGKQKIWITELDAGDGYTVLLMHAKPIKKLKAGQYIEEGVDIARVSKPGKGEESTGPHLHLEVRKNGKKINSTEILNNDGSYTETEITLFGQEISKQFADQLLKTENIQDFNKLEQKATRKNNLLTVTWNKLAKTFKKLILKREGTTLMDHDTNGEPSLMGVNKGAHPEVNLSKLTLNGATKVHIGDARFMLNKKMSPAMMVAVANAAALNPRSAEKFFYAAGGGTVNEDPLEVVKLTAERCERLAKKKKYSAFGKEWKTRNGEVMKEVQEIVAISTPNNLAKNNMFEVIKEKLEEQKVEIFNRQHQQDKAVLEKEGIEFNQESIWSNMDPVESMPAKQQQIAAAKKDYKDILAAAYTSQKDAMTNSRYAYIPQLKTGLSLTV